MNGQIINIKKRAGVALQSGQGYCRGTVCFEGDVLSMTTFSNIDTNSSRSCYHNKHRMDKIFHILKMSKYTEIIRHSISTISHRDIIDHTNKIDLNPSTWCIIFVLQVGCNMPLILCTLRLILVLCLGTLHHLRLFKRIGQQRASQFSFSQTCGRPNVYQFNFL